MSFNSTSSQKIQSYINQWHQLEYSSIVRFNLSTEFQFHDLKDHYNLFKLLVTSLSEINWELVPEAITDEIVHHFDNLNVRIVDILGFTATTTNGHQSLTEYRNILSYGFQSNLSALLKSVSQYLSLMNLSSGKILENSQAINSIKTKASQLEGELDKFNKEFESVRLEIKATYEADKKSILQAFFEEKANEEISKYLKENIRLSKRAILLILTGLAVYIAALILFIYPNMGINFPQKLNEVGPELIFKTTILIILSFIPLKIMIKLAMSYVHLGIDSRERLVLLNTYIAFQIKGGDKIGEEEKKIIFASIFKTASAGIVSEDFTPPIPQSIVAKIIDHK